MLLLFIIKYVLNLFLYYCHHLVYFFALKPHFVLLTWGWCHCPSSYQIKCNCAQRAKRADKKRSPNRWFSELFIVIKVTDFRRQLNVSSILILLWYLNNSVLREILLIITVIWMLSLLCAGIARYKFGNSLHAFVE